ncbi:MAG: EamA family transporter, partial [Oligoflexales bacterium]|nr:EamA family transporter [Oligoflexales bacterium]
LFMVALNIAPAVIAAPILLTFAKQDLINICRSYKVESLLVTAGGTASYVLILFAYQKAPTSYVIALREVSIIFASVLGVFILKERLYVRKKIAILLIVFGILVIKLAE